MLNVVSGQRQVVDVAQTGHDTRATQQGVYCVSVVLSPVGDEDLNRVVQVFGRRIHVSDPVQ